MADIEKNFHQVLVRDQDRGALRFVWCTSKKEQLRDIQMNVDSFGKVGSPCCYLWALKKTATDSITNIIARAKEAITETSTRTIIWTPSIPKAKPWKYHNKLWLR